ncbi:MAG: nickel-dependent lactate racemase, partial [Atopobiaceae bacterium]|nr:nickel-dependent lactate racemase [Atopobiaceae bacterium]
MELGFGICDRVQTVSIDEDRLLSVLEMRGLPGMDGRIDEAEVVRQALANPIGAPRLRDTVHPGERIVIISSDVTRPMPTATVLPPVLEELDAAGVSRSDISVVFALGSHREQSDAERERLMGEELFSTIANRDSSREDIVHLGVTAAGTPIDIDRSVAEADRRICLGNLEYHYFAGYSGGEKAIMPGCSTPEAIQANHRMMLEDAASTGIIEGNPVRADLEEAIRVVGVDHIVNVVLDENRRVVHAVAGDAIEAHRAGCAFLDSVYRVPIACEADIVIASQGGSPKDLNLDQTQKALDNAVRAVRQGGIVILVGSCAEGYGNAVFSSWLDDATCPDDLVERVNRAFQLGGHKAAAIALALRKA